MANLIPAGVLQIRGFCDIIAGGYPNEEKGVENAYVNWQNINDAGEVQARYWYSDSNRGSNAYRSQTDVTVKTVWNATMNDENVVTVHADTYLVRVERVAFPAGSNGDVGSVGRSVFVYAPGAPCSTSPAHTIWQHRHIAPRFNGTIFSGQILVSSADYVIPPAKSTNTKTLLTYRNVTDGYESLLCVDSTYTDAMVMGFQFRNNLPSQLPRPVLSEIRQEPDICEDSVTALMTFTAPGVGGANLYLEYRYEGEDWDSDRHSVTVAAPRTGTFVVKLEGLTPSRDNNNPVKVYWRAKYKPRTVQMEEGEWTYGEFNTIFVPPPNMSVPDITEPECVEIDSGNLIPPFDEIVCYGGCDK